MKLSAELVQELEVLSLFPREGTQMGLKFHHDAGPRTYRCCQTPVREVAHLTRRRGPSDRFGHQGRRSRTGSSQYFCNPDLLQPTLRS